MKGCGMLLYGVLGVVLISSMLGRCGAWRGMNFAVRSEFVDKKMEGGRVVTYTDVTAMTCAARCTMRYPCGSFSYSAADRVCTLCALCGPFRLVDAPGYQLFVSKEDPADASWNKTAGGACLPNSTAFPGCWRPPVNAQRAFISVGQAGTWAVDGSGTASLRSRTIHNPLFFGMGWQETDTKVSQLDVGRGVVWGVTAREGKFLKWRIVRGNVGKAKTMSSQGKWISVSPGGSLWAVNKTDQLVHFSNSTWQDTGASAVCVDVDVAGVWALNSSGHLLSRQGTYGDSGSAGGQWQPMEGTYRSVSSGRDLVVAVDKAGLVWLRTAVGPDTPTGLAWLRYPGYFRQVEIFQAGKDVVLWGTNAGKEVFFSRLND